MHSLQQGANGGVYERPAFQMLLFPAMDLATAGYDPLRHEGDAFARRLAAAGVDVQHVCHEDLVHGFLSFAALGGGFERASREAAAAVGLLAPLPWPRPVSECSPTLLTLQARAGLLFRSRIFL